MGRRRTNNSSSVPSSSCSSFSASLCLFSHVFPLSPCSFVADVIHWCGLLILQSGVRLAASPLFSLYCRPFVPRHGGRSSGPSQDGCDSRGQHTETCDGVKTQTGDTPRRNDTANLYLLSIFVSSVVPPHLSRLPALLFLITWAATRCLLHLIFRTVSVHNRPCMQAC